MMKYEPATDDCNQTLYLSYEMQGHLLDAFRAYVQQPKEEQNPETAEFLRSVVAHWGGRLA
jgi:hypothetical protein